MSYCCMFVFEIFSVSFSNVVNTDRCKLYKQTFFGIFNNSRVQRSPDIKITWESPTLIN